MSIVVNDDDKDDDEYHQFRAISARCFPVTATAVVRVVYIGLNSVGRKRIYFFPSFPPAPHSPSFALTIPRFFLHAVFINTGNKNNGRRFKSRQNTLMAWTYFGKLLDNGPPRRQQKRFRSKELTRTKPRPLPNRSIFLHPSDQVVGKCKKKKKNRKKEKKKPHD